MKQKSRTFEAYERVKFAILNGEYAPSQKLRIEKIAESLEVSPGAIREALSRLTSDSLVVAESQRGFFVAPISIDDLADLTAVRIEIECRCLRRSIQLGDLVWEGNLLSSHHQLINTPIVSKADDHALGFSTEWGDAHVRFHDAIISACDSPWWLKLRSQLYNQAERYRRLSVPYSKIDRNITEEHNDIMDACLARNSKEATRLLANHMQLTADILMASEVPFNDLPKAPPNSKNSSKNIKN